MPRAARKTITCDFVHVMIQGINKEYIFENNDDKDEFLYYIYKFQTKCNVEIISYCIMNNHAHLLLHINNSNDLSDYLKRCNQSYVKYYNQVHNRVGVLFRNRYKSEEVYDIDYVKNCIRYIHNNPVKAGIVTQAVDYKYSSCKDYVHKSGISLNNSLWSYIGKWISYDDLIADAQYKIFMDTDEDIAMYSQDDLLNIGINDYVKTYKTNLVQVLSQNKLFVNLINYLMHNFNVQANYIQQFFGISPHHFRLLKESYTPRT